VLGLVRVVTVLKYKGRHVLDFAEILSTFVNPIFECLWHVFDLQFLEGCDEPQSIWNRRQFLAFSICKRQRLGMAPSSTLHSSRFLNKKGQEIEAEEILFQNKPYSSLRSPHKEGGGFLSWATSLMLPLGLPQDK
jgi:hypothetical protein